MLTQARKQLATANQNGTVPWQAASGHNAGLTQPGKSNRTAAAMMM